MKNKLGIILLFVFAIVAALAVTGYVRIFWDDTDDKISETISIVELQKQATQNVGFRVLYPTYIPQEISLGAQQIFSRNEDGMQMASFDLGDIKSSLPWISVAQKKIGINGEDTFMQRAETYTAKQEILVSSSKGFIYTTDNNGVTFNHLVYRREDNVSVWLRSKYFDHIILQRVAESMQRSTEVSIKAVDGFQDDNSVSDRIDTSDWQVFHDSNGFEFRYPQGWVASTEGVNDIALIPPGKTLSDSDNLPSSDNVYWGDIVIDFEKNEKNLSNEEYVRAYYDIFGQPPIAETFVSNGLNVSVYRNVPGLHQTTDGYINGHGYIVEVVDMGEMHREDGIYDAVVKSFRVSE